MNRASAFVGFLAVVSLSSAASAVILRDSATRNTTEPTDALTGSGWQYEGQWSSFLGTPIAPQYFVTAWHVGGSVGDTFTFNGTPYTTVAAIPNQAADLTLWKISGTFPSYAPLYTKTNEAGKAMVVFGRGTQRGDVATIGGQPAGWYWGASDSVQSWGQNTVASNVTDSAVLGYYFGDPGTCILSSGDSGGGVFINDGGTWKLAGINHGVTSNYTLTSTDTNTFNAALYNQNGLYIYDPQSGQHYAMSGQGYSESVRISSYAGWIQTNVPEPTSLVLVVGGSVALLSRRRHRA